MIWLLAALAIAAPTEAPETDESPYPSSSIRFDADLQPPPADYAGDFDGPPMFHWSVELPGGRVNAATHTERARPVVSGETILIGAAGGTALYMLSRRDGTVLRTFDAGSSVESEAVVMGDRVYFTDTGGITWCYGLDGEFAWKHDSGAPILVRPTVAGGTVFVTNVNDLAVALDAGSGELQWRYQRRKDLTREAELALFAAPPAAISDDTAVMGFSDGAVVGIDKNRGDVLWERRVGEGRYPDIVAGAVPYGNDIYASGYFRPLVAIDKSTQNVRWRMEIGAANALIVDESSGVLYHPGTDGRMRAIFSITGAQKWKWDSGTSGALTTPVQTEAGIMVGSSDGGLYLVDAESGEETWRFRESRLLEGVTAAPVVHGRQVLFVTNAGRLYSMLSPRNNPIPDKVRAFFRVNATDKGS